MGESSCTGKIISFHGDTTTLVLPEQSYLVCDNLAYSCFPVVGQEYRKPVTGRCYLAYLIPLIRQADSNELAPYHVFHKRSISLFSRVLSVLIPSYGTYRTQEEQIVLSKVLERHLNISSTAISAQQREINDIRRVLVQDKMALDLILASQGGVCKVIGSECCTYISDASSAVHNVVADTERGIKELHEDHGWNPFGE